MSTRLPNDPVSFVKWVDIGEVEANDYNPNIVPGIEMDLLYKSILADGYTQPIVTFYDEARQKYVIVDGFHRYMISKTHEDIAKLHDNRIPVVVIEKSLKERMASTVRHNRARGKHAIGGMVNLVYSMLQEGMTEEKVCEAIGMSAEELIRVKHISGYAKLYEKAEYSRSWVPAVRHKENFTGKAP